jgi:UDP-N-acetylmuramate--alanine ligase
MGSVFEAYRAGQYLGRISLSVPGRHNAWNALAAMAVAIELGYSFETIAASLKNFHGAKRRFQIMGRIGTNVVVDDYANEALPGAGKAVDEWLRTHPAKLHVEHSLAIISQ